VDIWLIYILAAIGALTLIVLGVGLYKLNQAQARVNRSLDPILQKSKTLKIEISALKRSRLDRQRRLDNTGTKRP
jgi:uncharacterized protein YoxC